MKKYNFSAGPSILPEEVFSKASEAVKNYNNSGLSILEYSHRSSEIVEILEEARSLVLDLMQLNSNQYSALFLQGGASAQFFMVPYNLLDADKTCAIVDTGKWSANAIKEAANFGSVKVVASSKDNTYRNIPKIPVVCKDFAYLHITTNNTIYGTQMDFIPQAETLMIADMSSDIFSRKWDYSQYDLIYAGAQKNLGPAGATLVVVKNEILGKVQRKIPTLLDYQVHIDKKSSFNTPPVFAVYVCGLTLKWLKDLGIDTIEAQNNNKAELLYKEIDRNPFFEAYAEIGSRSKMNVNFTMLDNSLEDSFITHCAKSGVVNIKGHRSVGGFRASLYNAMQVEGVQKLVECMQSFKA